MIHSTDILDMFGDLEGEQIAYVIRWERPDGSHAYFATHGRRRLWIDAIFYADTFATREEGEELAALIRPRVGTLFVNQIATSSSI